MKKLFAALLTAAVCVGAAGALPAAATWVVPGASSAAPQASSSAASAGPSAASGTVKQVPDDFLEVTVPAGMYAFDQETSPADPNLEKVGLAGTWSQKRQEMEKAGNQLLILPQGGAYTISISRKTSTHFEAYYDMRGLSDEQFQSVLTEMSQVEPLANGSKPEVQAQRYDSPTLPFAHTVLRANSDGQTVVDACYFTIMNGAGYTIEIYQTGSELTAEQQAMLKSVADSARFTKFIPKPTEAEVAQREQMALVAVLVPLIGIVLLVGTLLAVSRLRRRRNRRRQAIMLERLSAYRQDQQALEQRAAAAGGLPPEPETLIENHTKCTTKVIKQFSWMDLLLNRRSRWIPLLLACILFVTLGILAVRTSAATGVLCMVAGAVFLIPLLRTPTQTFQIENSTFRKMKNRKRRYQFRERDFRVSDAASSAVYPYVQLIQVRETQEFFYLYLGEKHVYIVAKKSFTKGTPEDLRKLLDEKRIHF